MSDDLLATLTGIAREGYTTGAWPNVVLKMHTTAVDELRQLWPDVDYRPGTPEDPRVHTITGIPMVVDDELPAGAWRLADRDSGAVLHEGTLR